MSQYPPNNSQPPNWQGNQSQPSPQQPWGVPPNQSDQWGQYPPQWQGQQPSQPLQPNTGYQQPSGPQWPQQPPDGYPLPQYQRPLMPPGPPQKPPRKKLSRRTWIIIGVVVLILVVASAANANKSTATPTAVAPTATPIIVNSQATDTPIPATDTPTPKPTSAPKNTVGSQSVIGTTLSSFNAKYGQPYDHSVNANGTTTYKYQGPNNNISQINVFTYPNSDRIYAIIAGANAQNWDATTALTVCIAFIPEDAKLDQATSVQKSGVDVGLYQPGTSVELMNTLPASEFVDADSGATVKPGTYSVLYSYVSGSSGTEVNACSVAVGKQTTTSLTN